MAFDTFESLLAAGNSRGSGRNAPEPLAPYKYEDTTPPNLSAAFPCTGQLQDATLPFVAVASDGGSFSEEYGAENLLRDDSTVYCSEKNSGINLVLSLGDNCSFTVTRVDIRAPHEGFTSPLGQGLIFISWDYPSLDDTSLYDDVRSCSDYQRILREQVEQKGCLDAHDPVLFFDLGDYFSTSVSFDVPRSGRYVLVKLLRPRTRGGDNVDVQYVGLHGWTGTRGFPAADLC